MLNVLVGMAKSIVKNLLLKKLIVIANIEKFKQSSPRLLVLKTTETTEGASRLSK